MPTQVRNSTTRESKREAASRPERAITTVAIPDSQSKPKLSPALVVGIGLGLITFIAYMLTLSPTVNFVDSGELITVGLTGGVAHAPGYPLYTLMLIAAAALPFGDIAVRVNAVSAITAAIAVGLFFAAIYELLAAHLETRRKTSVEANISAIFASASAALLLGFSFLFWNWATQAKMYSLHFAFVAGLLWLVFRARRAFADAGAAYSASGAQEPGMAMGRRWSPRSWPLPARLMVALAVTLGFSFANHYMTWLLLPGSALLLLWPDRMRTSSPTQTQAPTVEPRDRRKPQRQQVQHVQQVSKAQKQESIPPWRWLVHYAPVLIVAGLAPLLLYLYLPIRASQHPVINWGTPDNWDDFWRHITVWQLRPYIGYKGNPLNFLDVAWGYALDQFEPLLGLVVALVAVVGIVRLVRANLPVLVATGITAVGSLFYALLYQLNGTSVYYVPVYMMVLIWSAVGMEWAMRGLVGQLNSGSAGWVRYAVPGVLILLPALWAFWANVGRAGHANDYVAEQYVRNGFDNFAPNAVVLTNHYDFAGPSYYLQYVLHERPDVAVIDKDLLRYPFYIDYIDRQYGALLAPIQDAENKYKEQERLWVNGTQTRELGTTYVAFLRAIITQAMSSGRPVYLHWITTGAEEDAVSEGLQTHPEGVALRVDPQLFSGPPSDPHFRLDGILTNKIFLDELDFGVARLYPLMYDRLAQYATEHNYPDQAAQFRDLATQVRKALGLAPQ